MRYIQYAISLVREVYVESLGFTMFNPTYGLICVFAIGNIVFHNKPREFYSKVFLK